jgi:hypothetical protein
MLSALRLLKYIKFSLCRGGRFFKTLSQRSANNHLVFAGKSGRSGFGVPKRRSRPCCCAGKITAYFARSRCVCRRAAIAASNMLPSPNETSLSESRLLPTACPLGKSCLPEKVGSALNVRVFPFAYTASQ